MIRTVAAPAGVLGLFGGPAGPAQAGFEALVIAGALLWLGYALTGLVPGWRDELVTRWALAFPALVLFALVLMLVHIATGGALFRSAAAVRLTVAALAIGLLTRGGLARLRGGRPAFDADSWTGIACSLGITCVWGVPVFLTLPLLTGGDVAWHAGWTEQLLNGQQTPSSPLSGDVPNYYPWLCHALLGLLTRLTPGGHAYLAFAPLQLLQVAGISAALFAIGHRFAGRWCGAAMALLGSATGGFGFLVAGGFEIATPRVGRHGGPTEYLGDLLFVRSYNPSFANLAPPYPRDVALALLVGALFLIARAGGSPRSRDYAPAGVVLGLVGLTQPDAFLVGLLAAVAVAARASAGRRLRTSAALLGPALALFALWAVPLAISYIRLGGFVDTTLAEPVSLPAWAILGGWGIITPLTAVGLVRALRSLGHPVVQVITAMLAAAVVPLAVTLIASEAVGGGFETLGREHRYWPMFGLALALLAGLGAHQLVAHLRHRHRALAVAGTVLILGFALPSPMIASVGMPSHTGILPAVEQALRGSRDQELNALTAYGDGVCSALAVDGRPVFSYAGFRVVLFGDPTHRTNAARIRWARIYERIVPEAQRLRDAELVLSGRATRSELQAVVERYGLDVLVVPANVATVQAFRGLSGRPVRFNGEPYVLFGLRPC
jgi:hypothetical protein